MGQIVRWPRHIRYNCDHSLNPDAELHCAVCNGGLFVCTTCSAAEGELTPDCPGVRMTQEQKRACYDGELTFRKGRWEEIDLLGERIW